MSRAQPPDLKHQIIAPSREPLSVRADGDGPAIVERSDLKNVFAGLDLGMCPVAQSYDLARTVLVKAQTIGRKLKPARRADSEYILLQIELNRPSPQADKSCGQQVTGCLEHHMWGIPDRQIEKFSSASKVPEYNPSVSAQGQQPAIAPDRRCDQNEPAISRMSKRSVFEGGIDRVSCELGFARDDNSSISAKFRILGPAGQAEKLTARDRIPDPQPLFQTGAGKQGAGGMETYRRCP